MAHTEVCYNNFNISNLVTGKTCTDDVKPFLNPIVLPNISTPNPIFAIASFENCFNDVCNTLLPRVPSAPKVIYDACDKKQKNQTLTLKVSDYKDMAHSLCSNTCLKDWNLPVEQREYAADACFSMYYLYELLHKLGLDDNTLLNVCDTII